ncbi:MAG: hypothetical protein H6751_03865 [Candidatus Omnitrophica bacterium]|nr:hypothetical protein [Candidatus Omnitrophota bacterium]
MDWRLVEDFIRRWWWALGLAFAWTALNSASVSRLFPMLLAIIYAGSLFDGEFNRKKNFRANRMLPVQGDRFGVTYWGLFIILPTVLVGRGAGIGLLFNREANPSILLGACSGVLLYQSFLFLTLVTRFVPSRIATIAFFASVLLIIQIVLGWDKSPEWRIVLYALTAIAVPISFLFSGQIATEYMNHFDSRQGANSRGSIGYSNDIGAWNWFNASPITQGFVGVVFLVAVYLCMTSATKLITSRLTGWSGTDLATSPSGAWMISPFFLIFGLIVPIILILHWGSAMRVWRALPMTSTMIAGWLLGWQFLLALASVTGIAILDFAWGRTVPGTSFAFLTLLALASISTATAACLYWGYFVSLISALSVSLCLLAVFSLGWLGFLTLWAIILYLGTVSSYRLLTKTSYPFRADWGPGR